MVSHEFLLLFFPFDYFFLLTSTNVMMSCSTSALLTMLSVLSLLVSLGNISIVSKASSTEEPSIAVGLSDALHPHC